MVHSWRIKTDARTTADELGLMFSGLLVGHHVDGISACSTVPAALRELRAMLGQLLPGCAHSPCRTGDSHRSQHSRRQSARSRRGPDRQHTCRVPPGWCGPAIVVDFGTSTNFDVVSGKGEFLGGALAPGIEISVDALASRAAQLRKVDLVEPRSPIGKNTVEALQSGILYGFAGQVDGLVRQVVCSAGARGPRVGHGPCHRRSRVFGNRQQRDRAPPRTQPDPDRVKADLRTQQLAARAIRSGLIPSSGRCPLSPRLGRRTPRDPRPGPP